MSSNVQLDPFVAQAQNDNVAPLQKIEGRYHYHLGGSALCRGEL